MVTLYVVAALTDVLDGYLARKWQVTSKFGALLDPIADKVLLATALILVVGEKGMPYVTVPVLLILGREVVVSGLREWMAEQGNREAVAVTKLAKIKTVTQNVAAILLLGCDAHVLDWRSVIAYLALYLAAILSIWTLVDYLRAAWSEVIS